MSLMLTEDFQWNYSPGLTLLYCRNFFGGVDGGGRIKRKCVLIIMLESKGCTHDSRMQQLLLMKGVKGVRKCTLKKIEGKKQL